MLNLKLSSNAPKFGMTLRNNEGGSKPIPLVFAGSEALRLSLSPSSALGGVALDPSPENQIERTEAGLLVSPAIELPDLKTLYEVAKL